MELFFKSSAFKRALILAICVFAAVIAASVFVAVWYGPPSAPVELEEIPEACELSLNEEVKLSDVLKEVGYKAKWISKEGIAISIRIKNSKGEYAVDGKKDVLSCNPKTRTFTARGIGEGVIQFTSKIDKSVSLSVPFRVSFASDDVKPLVEEWMDDGLLTRTEMEGITSLSISAKGTEAAPVKLSDLAHFPNLKLIRVTATELAYLSEPGKVGAIDFFVPEALYADYMKTEMWTPYRHFIFPELTGEGDYTVVYDGNGGTFGNTEGVTNGVLFTKIKKTDIISESKVPISKAGYTFNGWYRDYGGEDNVGSRLGSGGTPVGNLKYHAGWKEHQYTVKFNLNGGEGELSEKTLRYSEAFKPDMTGISRKGYTFLGWSVGSANSAVAYTADQAFSSLTAKNGDTVQLYAKWSANKYKVVYYDTTDSVLSTVELAYDEKAMAYDYTATSAQKGYHFAGWSKTKGAEKAEFPRYNYVLNLTEENGATVALYPVWEANTYSVIYYDDSVSTANMPAVLSGIKYGQTVSLSTATPTTKGKTFLGWSKKADAKTAEYIAGQAVSNLTEKNNESVVLYAVWKADTFTVVFNKTGAESGSGITAVVEYGKAFPVVTTLKKEGHHVAGWGYSSSTKLSDAFGGATLSVADVDDLYDTAKIVSSKTVHVYPIWDVNTYDVKYDLKGGTGTSTTQKDIEYDETFKLLGAPTKTGYDFLGWSESSTATRKDYSAGESVSTLTEDNDVTVTLYAVWSAKIFRVKFEGSTTETLTYGSKFTTPKPTKSGYTLLGWSTVEGDTSKEYGTSLSATDVKDLFDETDGEDTLTLYPVWKKN